MGYDFYILADIYCSISAYCIKTVANKVIKTTFDLIDFGFYVRDFSMVRIHH